MALKRKYDDSCAVAHALDLVGERWALLVVRELVLGPKRFTDLRAGIPRASPDVLTQRLRELQDVGVVRRRKLSPPAGSWVYELTDWGQDLEPIIVQLGRWASRSPNMRYDLPLSVDSLVLSLKALFDPRRAAGLTATMALVLDEDRFQVHVEDAAISVSRGGTERPDVTVVATQASFAALLDGERRVADVAGAGDVSVEGDVALVQRFLDLFPLPDLVEV